MKEMTLEEQKVAIAEVCGIEIEPCTCKDNQWKDKATGRHIPDYLNDRNAMIAVIRRQIDGEYEAEFWRQLAQVVTGFTWDEFDPTNEFSCFEIATAKASQLAEAFLLTIQKTP